MTQRAASIGHAQLVREPDPRVFGRRFVSVTAAFSAALLATLTAPLWIPLAAVVDAATRWRRCTLRCGLFFTFHLLCESAGLLAAFAVWVARPLAGSEERYLDWNFRLQQRWARALFAGASRIFGFRLEVEGREALEAGPMLLLLRHASVGDTLLAAVLVSAPHDIHLRYVLKHELLWDPCLDVVGNRLPNYFVRRGSSDTDREVRGIQGLMKGLGPREGVLIYPEGTRFTSAKRERALAHLRRSGNRRLAERAERLEHVLPPRLNGTLALLEQNPGLDVVVGAHAGFEGAARLSDLWRGALVGTVVRVRFWRIPCDSIPAQRAERVEWLLSSWERVDRWLDAVARARGSEG